MSGTRRPGMDHDHYDWSPISKRPRLKWPNDARVALCVIVSLEHFEWNIPETGLTPPGPYGKKWFHPFTNAWSRREYGHRVGIFNVMETLGRYGIRATVALDAATAENYPFIVKECRSREWEFIGHGLSLQRVISSKMNEEQEREYIRTSLNAVQKATGIRPVGWFGSQYSESPRTPQLLVDEGIRYICDWPNDEQPYRMKGNDAFFLPVTLELEDEFAMGGPRYLPITDYCQILQDAFDTLYHEGERTGRLLALSLHPHLIGQPFRVKYLNKALAHICKHNAVWKATGQEIIDSYARQQ